jgi:hypothetical protein
MKAGIAAGSSLLSFELPIKAFYFLKKLNDQE